jgi:hypothetical protein
MIEDPWIIQQNIQRYLGLLEQRHHTAKARQKILELLTEAQFRFGHPDLPGARSTASVLFGR